MKPVEILLKLGESQKVEFKEGISPSLSKEIVAFANAEGGRIFIGVKDTGEVIGFETTNRLTAAIQDFARNCDPPIRISISKERIGKAGILIVDVPEGDKKPYACGDGYYLRVGPTSQKLKRDELLEFIRKIRPYCFDEQPCPEFVYPGDFNKNAFALFMQKAKVRYGNIPAVDILKNIGVIAGMRGKKIIFNNAGVLFFAKEPCKFIRQSELTCVLFQSTHKADILDRKDMKGTLPDNVEQALVFLNRHLSLRYEIKTLQRKEILELPEDALREAIVNAVVHRDYSIQGAQVMVEMYRDRVEIVDPGGLPPGMKRTDLGKRCVHRNPRLVDLFHRIGEIEKIGSGISRMKEAAQKARVPSPRFEVSGFFVVKFKKPASQSLAETYPKSVPSLSQVCPKSVPSSIAEAVLSEAQQPVSIESLMVASGYTNRTRFRNQVVRPLVECGLLQMTIPDRPRSSKQKYVVIKK